MYNNSQAATGPQFAGKPQPPLGIIAENSSHAQNGPKMPQNARRFRLLRAARTLLPDERIAQCQHNIAPEFRAVAVSVNDVEDKATFRNLVRCDSPQCPFCSAARSERDRHELTIALAEAKRLNLYPLLVTFTLSHHAGDSLDDLRAGLRKAFDKTFSGRWYQDFKDRWHVVTKVTGHETTYGKNGWHPHLHVLMFCELEFLGHWPAVMQSEIATRWQDKLGTLGFSANLTNGVDVRTADSDIADYVAKWGHEPIDSAWGADVELSKANVKRSALGGLTPFQLLGAYAGIQHDLDAAMLLLGTLDRAALKKRCAALFCEFWYSYKGRARLHWGQTRKVLDLDVALENYEMLNYEEPPEQWSIVMIERGENWARVNGAAGDDLRADLLEVCASRDAWKVRSWLVENGISGIIPDVAWWQSVKYLMAKERAENGPNELHESAANAGPNILVERSGPGGYPVRRGD